MSWAIIADSSCNLRNFEPTAPDTIYRFAPLKINVGGTEYVDDERLDVSDLNRRVAEEEQATSSACPSAGEWADLFRLADHVIAITISENLSGSYSAALTARSIVLDEGPRDIFVLNSRAAGGKLELLVHLIDRYLTTTPSFEAACEYASSIETSSQVLYSLSNYENLAKAGRMPKMAGILANKLNIRILGTASSEGTIKIIGPARGEKKMVSKIIHAMESDGFTGGDVFIDHVENEPGAQLVAAKICATWPDTTIHMMPCGGLCSYYAERSGLILGYGWGPAAS